MTYETEACYDCGCKTCVAAADTEGRDRSMSMADILRDESSSGRMTPERIAKIRAALKPPDDRTRAEQALIANDSFYSCVDFGEVAEDLADALDEIERLTASR